MRSAQLSRLFLPLWKSLPSFFCAGGAAAPAFPAAGSRRPRRCKCVAIPRWIRFPAARSSAQVFASLTTSLILLAGIGAAAIPSGATVIHPAVVRVIAQERNGTSCGSGALVASGPQHGLVITNWHVVRDASGPILVIFPDGFRSGAKVLRTDRDWDLAALLIWRPNAKPIPLSSTIPSLGEPLTIAGYGSGWYRSATGRVSQYVTPKGSLPPEMVQVTTPARHGDSGGPMINARGELAGVLFGTDRRQTTGSHCGPVHRFVAPFVNDPRLRPVPESIPEVSRIAAGNSVPPPRPASVPILAERFPPVGVERTWRAVAEADTPVSTVAESATSPPPLVPSEAMPANAGAPVAISNRTILDASELDPLESLGICFAMAGIILLGALALRPLARFE